MLWHSLNESGDIRFYDVYWTRTNMIERDIPAKLLEAVKKKKHKHEVHVEDTPHPDRKKR